MSFTISTSPMYCPNEPTLIPWLPLQIKFCTMMSVLFGLNETQSSPLSICEFWMTIFELRYVSHLYIVRVDSSHRVSIVRKETATYPSVFFAVFLLTLFPAISIFENTTSVEFATRLYHCGLYLNLMSSILPPCNPIVPNRIGRRV